MNSGQRVIAILATTWGLMFLAALAVMVIGTFGLVPGAIPLFLLALAYAWMIFAYIHYRQGRQAEFLYILIAAAEARLPLAPALRAYLADRPHGMMREFWTALLLFFVFPGYYWLWHRQHSYDRKIALVVRLLENGSSLSASLKSTPGVGSREMVLAAAVGEATGTLPACLAGTVRQHTSVVWLEVLSRFLYPLILLLFLGNVAAFWLVLIAPRLQKIFRDFKHQMPAMTAHLMDAGWFLAHYGWAVLLALAAVSTTLVWVLRSPAARWYIPGLRRFYRMHVQGRIMRMLGVTLRAGQTVPQALALLSNSGYFGHFLKRRLQCSRSLIEHGTELADGLHETELVPAAAIPLIHSAQRAGNLPWALEEVGDRLAERGSRLLRRFSMVVAPMVLLAVGALVGYFVIGVFIPLIEMIAKTSQ
jgi:type IV pilus assembly protein PilC